VPIECKKMTVSDASLPETALEKPSGRGRDR
jgi:hypothetical protein